MSMRWMLPISLVGLAAVAAIQAGQPPSSPLSVEPRPIATDKSVKYDYDIVYVRAPRYGDKKYTIWAEIARPTTMEPGADLMLLHPDGTEEVLVEAGKD